MTGAVPFPTNSRPPSSSAPVRKSIEATGAGEPGPLLPDPKAMGKIEYINPNRWLLLLLYSAELVCIPICLWSDFNPPAKRCFLFSLAELSLSRCWGAAPKWSAGARAPGSQTSTATRLYDCAIVGFAFTSRAVPSGFVEQGRAQAGDHRCCLGVGSRIFSPSAPMDVGLPRTDRRRMFRPKDGRHNREHCARFRQSDGGQGTLCS